MYSLPVYMNTHASMQSMYRHDTSLDITSKIMIGLGWSGSTLLCQPMVYVGRCMFLSLLLLAIYSYADKKKNGQELDVSEIESPTT